MTAIQVVFINLNIRFETSTLELVGPYPFQDLNYKFVTQQSLAAGGKYVVIVIASIDPTSRVISCNLLTTHGGRNSRRWP